MAERFDAIVVGAGLGGLTGAALLARGGQRVLVLERNDDIGGAATVYRHGPLVVEASLHEIDGLDDDDPKMPVMRSLGLDRDLDFVSVPDIYEVRGGPVGAPFVLPYGVDAATKAALDRFPQHAEAIRKYFAAIMAVRDGAAFAYAHMEDRGWWLRHLPDAAQRLWPVLRHAWATVGEVFDRLFGEDEAVKCALAGNVAYYHDDPHRMSFLSYAAVQGSFVAGGGHYVRGGSRRLTDRLADLVRAGNGVVLTGRDVHQILLDGDRVAGVVHRDRSGADAQAAHAPVVLGNAAPSVLAQMLPPPQREAFAARYVKRPVSTSLWVVSLGLERPARNFGVAHYSTAMLPDWMHALSDFKSAADLMADPDGDRLPPFGLSDYAQIDSGLTETGPYLCTLTGADRLDHWESLELEDKRARKARWMDRLVARVDAEFPGFAGAVVHRQMATASTMHRTLNTPGGAVYGFAPEFFTASARTPIKGLYLASAWGMGGGYTGAMLGGAAAAREAVRAA